jgi:hypothetical protein
MWLAFRVVSKICFLHMLDAGSTIWYDVDLLKGLKINADKK